MIIDCISDLHGHYPELEGGDLLIVAGDLTARDTDKEHLEFIEWISYSQKYENKYKKVIYIAGNHDNFLYDKNRYGKIKTPSEWNIEYLCDSGTTFRHWPVLKLGIEDGTILDVKDYKIWGSPWTKTFPGMNQHCKAFTCDTEEELSEKWAKIPDDIDILITHGAPKMFLDQTCDGYNVGSSSLSVKLFDIQPRLHVYGHIHEAFGEFSISGINWKGETKLINCSHVNEHYKPVNKPVRIVL